MAQTSLPNIGVDYEHTLGDDAWKNSYDANWIITDTLAQGYVIDDDLAAEPGTPNVGDAYILPSGTLTGTNWSSDTGAVANSIAIYANIPGLPDSSPWIYLVPRDGWLVYQRTDDYWMMFDVAATPDAWVRNGHLKHSPNLVGDTSGNFTPGLSDANDLIVLQDAFDDVNDNLVIPTNATVGYPIGTELLVRNEAGGTVNLTTTGVSFEGTAPTTIADGATLRLVKILTDTWAQV